MRVASSILRFWNRAANILQLLLSISTPPYASATEGASPCGYQSTNPASRRPATSATRPPSASCAGPMRARRSALHSCEASFINCRMIEGPAIVPGPHGDFIAALSTPGYHASKLNTRWTQEPCRPPSSPASALGPSYLRGLLLLDSRRAGVAQLVCTENLNTGVAVMKSAQDGA